MATLVMIEWDLECSAQSDLHTVLLRALESEDVTKNEDDDEGESGELETARSISETSSTAPCATFVYPIK